MNHWQRCMARPILSRRNTSASLMDVAASWPRSGRVSRRTSVHCSQHPELSAAVYTGAGYQHLYKTIALYTTQSIAAGLATMQQTLDIVLYCGT